jgi:hypothetical protein
MRIWILKFGVVFFFMTVICTVVWEEFIDGKVYDCTDPLFGYLSPDGWVGGNNFPVVVVKKVISGRSMSEPDELKEGWSVPGLWVLWGSFFASSLIVSFLLARLPWPKDRTTQAPDVEKAVTHRLS